MGEVRFMISEAAKQVHVESHVLRYWEEELNLKIGRTEMGHRYYTEDDIQLFLCIRKLKNEGMLLRDLKPLIPQLTATRKKLTDAVHAPAGQADPKSCSARQTDIMSSSSGLADTKDRFAKHADVSDVSAEDTPEHTSDTVENTSIAVADNTGTSKAHSGALIPADAEVIPVTQLEQVRNLIGDVLTEVVTSNNTVLEQQISQKVTTDVIREMDFLFQAKERQEEEHYRKLDSLIRQQQTRRRETASRENPLGRFRKIFT